MESAEDNFSCYGTFLGLSRCKDPMSFIDIHHSEIKAILKPQIDILM